jgi:hypothetical protein
MSEEIKRHFCPFCKEDLHQSHLAKRKFCNNHSCSFDEPLLTRFYIDFNSDKIEKQCVRIGSYLMVNDLKFNKFSLFHRSKDYLEIFTSKSIDAKTFDENFWNERLNLILTFV